MAGAQRILVLTDPTLLVRHANDRLVMVRDKKEVAAVPVADLAHVAVHGPVTMTGAAVARLMEAGVDVTLYSSSGSFRGVMHGHTAKNVYLLLAQVDAWKSDQKRLALARPIVSSKIAGQRMLLLRVGESRGSARIDIAVERMLRLEEETWDETKLDSLRGLEGAAAAAYFDAFGECLAEGWEFPKRVRRPPTDPVNALLSFGYALATGELVRQLHVHGFDPRIGFLHGLRYGRVSLALDLLEEFRAPMVDRFTLSLINRKQLRGDEFEEHIEGGVRLNPEARRRYLELWEEMMVERAPKLRHEPEAAALVVSTEVARVKSEVREEEEGGRTWRKRMEGRLDALRRYLLHGEEFRPLQRSAKVRGR